MGLQDVKSHVYAFKCVAFMGGQNETYYITSQIESDVKTKSILQSYKQKYEFQLVSLSGTFRLAILLCKYIKYVYLR